MGRLCDRRTNRRTNSVETPLSACASGSKVAEGVKKKTLLSDLSISLRFAASFFSFSSSREGGRPTSVVLGRGWFWQWDCFESLLALVP